MVEKLFADPEDAPPCIYCGELGPYKKQEHVVSAGLGSGDDPEWLLSNCVCDCCNHKFSKIELHFLRASPVGLARFFFQPRARDRGKKTRPPKLETTLTEILDPDTAAPVEVELRQQGPIPLPQLIFMEPDHIQRAHSDKAIAEKFDSRLRDLLSTCVKLIEKVEIGGERVFRVSALIWSGEGNYDVASDITILPKPPTKSVWFEELADRDDDYPSSFVGCLLQRPDRQIVVRSRDLRQAARILTGARRIVAQSDHSLEREVNRVIRKPQVRAGIRMNPVSFARVLTKTGLNLCAKMYGPDFVRDSAFDQARNFVLDKTDAWRSLPATKWAHDWPGFRLENCHLLLLNPINGPHGTVLLFIPVLYGVPLDAVILGTFDSIPSHLDSPRGVRVNYHEHSITEILRLTRRIS